MDNKMYVATAPKTATFQMRINPVIKSKAEEIYAQCGLTLTDAINIFIQQSINIEGMPLLVTTNSKEALKQQAVTILMRELSKGKESVKTKKDLIPESDILSEFGIAE